MYGNSGEKIDEVELEASDAVDVTIGFVTLRISAIGGFQTEAGYVGAGVDQSLETVFQTIGSFCLKTNDDYKRDGCCYYCSFNEFKFNYTKI